MNSPKSQYEAQKDGKWKLLTNSLSQAPLVKTQLNNFIKTIYQKFRQQKNLPQDFKPTIEFKGFAGFQDFPTPTKMGHCDSQLKTTWQTLNGQKVEGSETYSGSISIPQPKTSPKQIRNVRTNHWLSRKFARN